MEYYDRNRYWREQLRNIHKRALFFHKTILLTNEKQENGYSTLLIYQRIRVIPFLLIASFVKFIYSK